MSTADPDTEPELLSPTQIRLVRHHLREVLASHAFAGSKRTQDFLHLIVGHALEGEVGSLRERMIGAEMFGRPVDYDTGSDSVVRVKATEVRKRLAQYYREATARPAVRIGLPSGSYVPRFTFEPPAEVAPPDRGEQSAEQNNGASAGRPAEKAGPAGTPSEARSPLAVKLRRSPRVFAGAVLALILIALACYAGVKKWYLDPRARGGIRSSRRSISSRIHRRDLVPVRLVPRTSRNSHVRGSTSSRLGRNGRHFRSPQRLPHR